MIRRFRLFIASFVLLSFLVCDTDRASAVIDPFTVSVVASALFHAAVIGGAYLGWRTYKRENGGARNPSGTKITPNGTIGRDVKVEWVDLTKTDFVDGKNATAKATMADIKQAVDAEPSRFPKLKTALQKSSLEPLKKTSQINDIVSAPGGGTYKIYNKGYYTNAPNSCTYGSTSGEWKSDQNGYKVIHVYDYTTSSPCGGYTWFHMKTNAPPPPRDATPSEFAQAVSNSSGLPSAPADVYSDFYGEIDDYLTGNGGTLSVVDTDNSANVDSAPPLSMPSMPTPSQFSAAQSAYDAQVAQAAAHASAQNALAAAQAAAGTAQINYNFSNSGADLQKLNDALKAVADAQAALDKLKADQAKQNSDAAKEAAEEESISPPSASDPYGDDTEIDISGRVNQFFSDIRGTTLFSLPDRLLSGLPSGGSPVMSVDCGRWGVKTVDFSSMSSALQIIKTIFLIAFSFCAIRIVVLKGGGG